MEKAEFYKCERCGNIVALLVKGGGTLSCCGEPMKLLEAKSSEAGMEKHLPVIEHKGAELSVKVGSVPHPMLEEHHIVFIALVSDGHLVVHYLKAGDKPETSFRNVPHGTVYSYCNVHGLWKAEF
jgi:superoxide reductase